MITILGLLILCNAFCCLAMDNVGRIPYIIHTVPPRVRLVEQPEKYPLDCSKKRTPVGTYKHVLKELYRANDHREYLRTIAHPNLGGHPLFLTTERYGALESGYTSFFSRQTPVVQKALMDLNLKIEEYMATPDDYEQDKKQKKLAVRTAYMLADSLYNQEKEKEIKS